MSFYGMYMISLLSDKRPHLINWGVVISLINTHTYKHAGSWEVMFVPDRSTTKRPPGFDLQHHPGLTAQFPSSTRESRASIMRHTDNISGQA